MIATLLVLVGLGHSLPYRQQVLESTVFCLEGEKAVIPLVSLSDRLRLCFARLDRLG